jgi:hypothetical protein
MQHLDLLLASFLLTLSSIALPSDATWRASSRCIAPCAPAAPEPLDPIVGDWELQAYGAPQKLKVWVGPSGTLQAKLDGKKVGITSHGDGVYCIHGFKDKPKACWFDIHLDGDGQAGSVATAQGGSGTVTKV